eukprot:GEMP01070004.1.p2 GENE.GEMP01070004.1~~GEMP01070004.1.p2  ORF type:complete len:165 (+),score=15.17 GEMP01070004.1:192-686(+)
MERSQSASGELGDPYLATVSPYISLRENSLLMGPHPLSQTRRSIASLPAMQMGKVWSLRRSGACPIPSGKSETAIPIGDKKHREYTSHRLMRVVQRKHTRSAMTPLDKWEMPCCASQLVGWEMQKPDAPVTPWLVAHPKLESKSTQHAHSMTASKVELMLRFPR